jgi:capsular polysaccharide biosynthesis protein
MSQRSLNARQVVQIVRRHRILVGAVAVAGLLIGVAISVLYPPLVTGTSLVVLPGKAQQTATQVVIVDSEPVLSRALPAIHPSMSLQKLKDRLHVQSLAVGVISVSVSAGSAGQANSAANAVADSYIAYVQNPLSPVGHISAELLQPAVATPGMKPLVQDAIDGGLGLLAGLVAGTAAAVVIRRRSGRLFALDDMASSIGVPVLAAVSAARPREAADWARLLDDYQPGAVDAWRLRQALLEMGVTGPAGLTESAVSVTVLPLPADQGALALGPQLAAFAASLEIPTLLVVGTQRDSDETAALYTACAVADGSARHSPFLRTVAAGTTEAAPRPAEKLVLVVAVAGSGTPPSGAAPVGATVLGVSAGAATAEQLARLAMDAAAHGGEVIGLLVADPDPADRTSGRFPRQARQGHRVQPSGKPAYAAEPAAGSDPEPVRDNDARLDFSRQASVPLESS